MELKAHLTHHYHILLTEIMSRSLSCASPEDFKALIAQLQVLLLFDHAIAGLCTF